MISELHPRFSILQYNFSKGRGQLKPYFEDSNKELLIFGKTVYVVPAKLFTRSLKINQKKLDI